MDVLFFGVCSVVFGFGAIVAPSTRLMFWLLWLCGLFLAGAYLSIGTEFLAFVQILLVTVSSILYFFFGYLHSQETRSVDPKKFLFSLGLGAIFLGSLWYGFSTKKLPEAVSSSTLGLSKLGQYLVGHQFLSFELMGVLFFVVMVGVGVLARR